MLNEMILKSRDAQKQFETFSQSQVDMIVREIGKVVYDNAEMLAEMAIEETRMVFTSIRWLKTEVKQR